MIRRVTFLAAAFLSLTALGWAADFTGIVAFGDSLSDMGNRWLDSGKGDIKFKQTWVARLAGPAMFNFPGFKPSGIASFYGGSNYAVGGATTAATSAAGSERNRGQDLTQQVSKRYLDPAFNAAGVQPDALHVVVIGTNDIMVASVGAEQILSQWSGLEKTASAIAQSTEGQIRALAEAGVKRALWGNVFDVAQAPSVVKRANLFPSLAPAYLAAVTRAVKAHNTEMDAAITRLEMAHPTLQIIKLDLFARFNEMAADPAKFGFTDVTTGANDDKHLFSADGLHPTPQGHRKLAEYAFRILTEQNAARSGSGNP